MTGIMRKIHRKRFHFIKCSRCLGLKQPYCLSCTSIANFVRVTLMAYQIALVQKKMFIGKSFSGVLDYMMNFQLLQYQYDRWLYKTVLTILKHFISCFCLLYFLYTIVKIILNFQVPFSQHNSFTVARPEH